MKIKGFKDKLSGRFSGAVCTIALCIVALACPIANSPAKEVSFEFTNANDGEEWSQLQNIYSIMANLMDGPPSPNENEEIGFAVVSSINSHQSSENEMLRMRLRPAVTSRPLAGLSSIETDWTDLSLSVSSNDRGPDSDPLYFVIRGDLALDYGERILIILRYGIDEREQAPTISTGMVIPCSSRTDSAVYAEYLDRILALIRSSDAIVINTLTSGGLSGIKLDKGLYWILIRRLATMHWEPRSFPILMDIINRMGAANAESPNDWSFAAELILGLLIGLNDRYQGSIDEGYVSEFKSLDRMMEKTLLSLDSKQEFIKYLQRRYNGERIERSEVSSLFQEALIKWRSGLLEKKEYKIILMLDGLLVSLGSAMQSRR